MFHPPFYPNLQTFPNNRTSANFFVPPNPFFHRYNGPVLNQSAHNLNFTHDFDRFSMPSGGYPFSDATNHNFDQHRWRQNMSRPQHHRHHRPPAAHFQDKSTSYYMTDPILTNDERLTIHLTKVHVGPNGDQQRVFVEQEFSNEKELNNFVRNLRRNFEKVFNKRSPAQSSHTDDSKSTDSKKSGMVVVEEPDEEPKIYQQQAYNAKIESRKAAASFITPPLSPKESTPPRRFQNRSPPPPPPPNKTRHRAKYASPVASRMSSTSTTHSNRHHRNKMKYRRQPTDNREEFKASRISHMPSYSRQYQTTPIPPRFQQRFFPPNNSHIPPNSNFQWRPNQTSYPKHRSRSYVPPMNDNIPPPPPPPPQTPSHFPNLTDPFFRPIHPPRFVHPRQKQFHPPSPANFFYPQHQQSNHPTTITDNLLYPNHEQQQPRVHRTKSESRNFQKQHQHRSQSTTNHFQKFSPLQQPPTIQRHFVPFRSPPMMSTASPRFYPNQKQQFGSIQPQTRLINHFHLGTNRF